MSKLEAYSTSSYVALQIQRLANVSSLPAFTGDSGSGGVQGLVPAPPVGSAAAGKFLKADGTFQVPSFGFTASNTIIGNNTGGSAVPFGLTGTQATALLTAFTGDSGTGGVKGLVPAPAAGDALASKFVKADGTWSTPYRETIGSTFWKTVTTSTTVAYQARIADRLFVGAAVKNDGKLWLDGSYPLTGFSDLDWWGDLSRTTYNGALAAQGSDVNFAQSAVLFDHTSPAGALGVPQIAFLASTQCPNATVGATPRAGEFVVWNNPTTVGADISAWALYLEAHRLTTNTGNTYGIELAVRNLAPCATNYTPYQTPSAGSFGINIQCGAGLSATGQFPSTAALYVAAVPIQWAAGIIFFDGAVGPYGVGSSKPAMMMPYDHSIQWFVSGTTLSAQMYGDTYGNFYISVPGGGAELRTSTSFVIPSGSRYTFGNSGTAYISGSTASSFVALYTSSTERARVNDNGLVVTGNLYRGAPVTKTTSFTLGATENWVICNGAGSITVTLPAAASYTGREIMIKTIAAQTVVSASSNVVPLAGGAAGTAILAATAGKYATLVSDGTNWIIVEGN